jgi:hypothetical protein
MWNMAKVSQQSLASLRTVTMLRCKTYIVEHSQHHGPDNPLNYQQMNALRTFSPAETAGKQTHRDPRDATLHHPTQTLKKMTTIPATTARYAHQTFAD